MHLFVRWLNKKSTRNQFFYVVPEIWLCRFERKWELKFILSALYNFNKSSKMVLNVIVFFLRAWENLQLCFFLFSEKKFIKKMGEKTFFVKIFEKKVNMKINVFWWVFQMIHHGAEKWQLDVFPCFLVVSKTKNGKWRFFFDLVIQKIRLIQASLFHCLLYQFKRWKKKIVPEWSK